MNKKVVTGSSFAKQGDGVKGIMVYEAIEDAIAANIDNIYSTLGREGEGSVGRYHWETWVADSEQEASHGTLDAIMAHARGDNMAIHQVTAKQGEYGSYQYAARYGVDGAGTRYVDYATATGEDYTFTVPQFVEFQRLLKLAKSGVIPKDFLVTETGNEPWYQRAEVDREALDRLAEQIAEGRSGSGAGTFLKDGADEALPPRYTATGFEQAGKQQPRAQFAPYGVMLDQNGKPITLIQMFESADRYRVRRQGSRPRSYRRHQRYDDGAACGLHPHWQPRGLQGSHALHNGRHARAVCPRHRRLLHDRTGTITGPGRRFRGVLCVATLDLPGNDYCHRPQPTGC